MEQITGREPTKISTISKDEDDLFQDRFDNPGKISLARIHGSAQRPLDIPTDWDPGQMKNVQFCDCCYLPEQTPGIINPYNICSDIKSFSSCGIGVYLYFVFVKYLLYFLIVAFIMAALPTLLLSKYYSSQVITYCQKYYLNSTSFQQPYTNSSKCVDYLNNTNTTGFDPADWLNQMNSENLKVYMALIADKNLSSEELIVNYHFLYFLSLLVLFFINCLFITLVRTFINEVDLRDESPSDYTLMVSDVPRSFEDTDDLVNNILAIENLKPIEVNLTWKLNEYFELKDKYSEARKKLAQCQKNGMDIYTSGCCCKTTESKEKLREVMNQTKSDIKSFIEIIKKSRDSYTKLVFAVFNTEKDLDKYYDFFPNSSIGLLWAKFHFTYANCFCCCCYSKQRKDTLEKKLQFIVERAPEPQDLIWENLEYSQLDRVLRTLWTFLISLIFMCISFGIVVALNYGQYVAREKGIASSFGVKYALSCAIAVVISVINVIISSVLKSLTMKEKARSLTDFYLSFSIKLTLFTFTNSAIIPLISNYIQYGLDLNEVLVNNLLLIFLSNALANPVLNFAYIRLLVLKCKRSSLEKNFNHDEPLSSYTQRELNELYENPNMNISYKYSFIARTTLLSFFYITIFPIGLVISIIGIFLSYMIEKINFIYVYKRPEMINQSLCEFYFTYSKFALFAYAVGNWIFLSGEYESNIWEFINIVTFGCLCALPFHKLLTCDLLGYHDEINTKEYMSVYFEFPFDYQRLNPLTRKKGMQIYVEHMKTRNIISDEEYGKITEEIQNVNVMELYYNTSANLLKKQRSMLSSKYKARSKRSKLFDCMHKLVEKIIHNMPSDTQGDEEQRDLIKKNTRLRHHLTNFLLFSDMEHCLTSNMRQESNQLNVNQNYYRNDEDIVIAPDMNQGYQCLQLNENNAYPTLNQNNNQAYVFSNFHNSPNEDAKFKLFSRK